MILVLSIMLSLQFTIMFGNEGPKIISVFLFMELGMLNKFVQLNEILKGEIQTLNQD